MLPAGLNLNGGSGAGAALLALPKGFGGKEIWVCNRSGAGGSVTNPGTPDMPLDTIANAVSTATASQGDVIYVMEGHAESLASAAAIALSKQGIKYIGLGDGSDRPTLTWTATAATMTIAAANVTMKNFTFDFTGIDAVVTALVISATSVKFHDCRFITAIAAAQATRCIVASTADGLGFYDCRFEGSADTGTASCIKVTGDTLDPRGFEFVRCTFNGFYTTSCFEFVTTGPKNVRMIDCLITSTATGVAVVVTWVGTETGQLVRVKCKIVAGQGIQPFSATPATVALHDCTCADGSGENGAAVLGAGTST